MNMDWALLVATCALLIPFVVLGGLALGFFLGFCYWIVR